MKGFWYDWSETIVYGIVTILAFATIASVVLFGITATNRGLLKYNCNLDTHPSWHLALWIDDSPYAYEPEKFCADVRNRMNEGK